jgi:hypothetical protein
MTMATKKKNADKATNKARAALNEDDVMDSEYTEADDTDHEEGGWHEEASTASVRWYVPDETSNSAVAVRVEERFERGTRFGNRAAYMCRVVGSGFSDVKGELEDNLPLIVWESAGLKDLNRYIGKTIKIVPSGRTGRTRTYRYFVKG